ncbi:uncharacterized protein LOC111281691 [Durio zibethinus]|uniref:Uncharacterized protein LOC111281691 n=1 Tax=Durio zibethinus TaxID=66656 RepID=A0A6P5X9J7_DURZI|nr:uncharacterized protein LOC111281691 [Durio zibethinus]
MSSQQIKIGPHEFTVKPDFRDKALQVSSCLCLDEVQSYILVDRYLERGNTAENYIVRDPIHVDVDLFTLWAEETLLEDNLVLDIIFFNLYELCSLFVTEIKSLTHKELNRS